MTTRQRRRGRLAFPARDALVAGALKPFPRLAFRPGRCPGCDAAGMGYAVLQAQPTGGMCAQHVPGCPLGANIPNTAVPLLSE